MYHSGMIISLVSQAPHWQRIGMGLVLSLFLYPIPIPSPILLVVFLALSLALSLALALICHNTHNCIGIARLKLDCCIVSYCPRDRHIAYK